MFVLAGNRFNEQNGQKKDVLQRGLELFFPSGFSSNHGPLSEYSCNLLDYQENDFDENFTVGNMYKLTNLPMLRFYVSTDKNKDEGNLSSNEKDLFPEKPPVVDSSAVTPTATPTAVASAMPVTYQAYGELFTDQKVYDYDSSMLSRNVSPFVDHQRFAPILLLDNRDNDEVSVAEILKKFVSEHRLDKTTTVNVFRGDVWNCSQRMIKRPSFSPFKEPSVMFTYVDDVSEGAIDVGGPRREFFRLLLDEIKSNIFEGAENAKQLVYRSDFYHEERYYHAAVLIAMSLFHRGPAPSFFSENFYKAFCGHEVNLEIFNEDVSLASKDLKEAANLNTLNLVVENPHLVLAGCPSVVVDLSRKDVILKEDTVDCKTEDILMFATGLKTPPPLGFPQQPSIKFLYENHELLPEANPCEMSLSLPTVHQNYK